jgi:hypothetical protein
MATYYKAKLSGTTEGAPLKITAVNSTGAQTVHTCTTSSGANDWDEIYLWAHSHTEDDNITIEYGDTDTKITQRLNYNSGVVQIVPGLIGNGSLVIKAFKGSTGSEVFVEGFVNQVR